MPSAHRNRVSRPILALLLVAALPPAAAACASVAGGTSPENGSPSSPSASAPSASSSSTTPTPSSAVDGGGADADADADASASTSASANCGTAGHDCLGGACVAGVCQPVLVTTQGFIELGPVGDATRILIGGVDVSGLLSFPHGPGASTPLAPMLFDTSTAVTPLGGDLSVLDGDLLYFNYRYLGTTKQDGIGRVHLTTGMSEPVTTTDTAQSGWSAPFIVDGATLYWADSTGVYRRPIAGGAQEEFAPIGTTGQVQRMTSDNDSVYLAASASVYRVSKQTKAITPLGGSLDNGFDIGSIAVDGDNVYAGVTGGLSCTDGSDYPDGVRYPGTVWRISKSGSTDPVMLDHRGLIDGLVALDGHVYWIEECTGDLRTVSATDTPMTIWKGAGDHNKKFIAVADKLVYFRNSSELRRWVP